MASLREVEDFAYPDDPVMTSIAREAAELCAAAVGMVSLMEAEEERTLAVVGASVEHIDRAISFCAYTILEPDALAVEDASTDPRFRYNPFVVGEPYVRFYAGAPFLDGAGLPWGSVCVVDPRPHTLSSKGLLALRRLASVAAAVLEARRLFAESHPPKDAPARLDALLLTLVEPRSLPGD